MTGTTGSDRGDRGTAVAASAAGIAAAGAFACAACCILPFTLPAAALAVTSGMLAWLASIYEGAIIVAIALVAAAWIWVIRQSLRTRKRPAAATVMVTLGASVMLALAYFWPAIEPLAVAALGVR
jgi:hypothetical protein